MTSNVTRPWATVLTAAVVLLAGCTAGEETSAPVVSDTSPVAAGAAGSVVEPATEPAPAPGPVFQPLDLTPAVGGPRDRWYGTSTVSADTHVPALVAAIRSHDATHAELHTLTSSDGDTWTDLTLPTDGGVLTVAAAGNDRLAAVSGTTTTEGTPGRFLFTSTDRRDWAVTQVPVPRSKDDQPVAAVVDDAVLYLVDNDDTDGGLVTIRDGATTRTVFPAAPAGVDRSPVALAGTGSTVVVLTIEGPADADRPVLSRVSRDGGRTWSAPATVTGPFDGAAGIAWTGTAFVVTGHSRTDTDAPTRMAAWSSSDGASWQADPVGIPDDDSFVAEDDSAWLSAPTASSGAVMASATSDGSLTQYIYERTDEAGWTAGRPVRHNDNTGLDSAVAVLGPRSGPSVAPVVLVTDNVARSVTLSRLQAGGSVRTLRWGDEERSPWLGLDDVRSTTVELSSIDFEISTTGDGGWRRTVTTAPFTWSAAAGLTAAAWDPAEIGDSDRVARGTAPDGSEVVLFAGFDFDRAIHTVNGYHRDAPTSAWEPVAPFPRDIDTIATGVAPTADGWLAYGYTGPRYIQLTLWTSHDGKTWQQQDVVDPAHPQLEVSDECPLSDGRLLVVGHSTDGAGVVHPLTLTSTTEGWVPVVHDDLPPGQWDSCATTGGSTIVSGREQHEAVAYRTVDGNRFARVTTSPSSAGPASDVAGRPVPDDAFLVVRNEISAVTGGFVATGSFTSATYSGAVLWLSLDGAVWRWLPLPTPLPSGSVQSRTVGDDVVLLLTTRGGYLGWRVTGLAEAFG